MCFPKKCKDQDLSKIFQYGKIVENTDYIF